MRLAPPQTPHQALRLVAAVLTVILVVLLGGLGTKDPDRPTYHHYVALGDSYTAAPFVPLTDVADGCFRSSNNYPNLIAGPCTSTTCRTARAAARRPTDLPGGQLTVRARRWPRSSPRCRPTPTW